MRTRKSCLLVGVFFFVAVIVVVFYLANDLIREIGQRVGAERVPSLSTLIPTKVCCVCVCICRNVLAITTSTNAKHENAPYISVGWRPSSRRSTRPSLPHITKRSRRGHRIRTCSNYVPMDVCVYVYGMRKMCRSVGAHVFIVLCPIYSVQHNTHT